MKIQIKNDCYVAGDIHGETKIFTDMLSYYNIKDCTIILLGDIGIWRYRDYKHYLKIDEYGKDNNVMFYAIRGNHDNPVFFKAPGSRSAIIERFWNKFTNFKVLPDLTQIEVDNSTGIVIGGGVSIDRCLRRSFQSLGRNNGNVYKSNDWWADETVPNTDNINEKYDFILSHTGPRPVKLLPLNEGNCSFFTLDQSLKDSILEETKRIEEIRAQFNPKKWWFGHYHINDSFDFYDTRCYAIDINYISPLKVN